MRFSASKIRRENARATRRYDRLGISIFRKALKKQASQGENFAPKIMEDSYLRFYEYVFTDSAKRGYNTVRKYANQKDFEISDLFLSTWRAWIKEWVIKNLGTQIQRVNETTLNDIKKVLADSLELGLNTFEIEDRLIRIVGSKARARAISITEGTRANNMGQKRSAEDYASVTGLTFYKVWIHSGATREPRFSHISAQNNPIPKDDFFNIEGVLLDTPGNPLPGQAQSEVAKQVINCGCTVAYITEEVAKERF